MALMVILTNRSNLAPVSDYCYEVLVGDGTPENSKTICLGIVAQHVRADGWQELVSRVLQQNPVEPPPTQESF